MGTTGMHFTIGSCSEYHSHDGFPGDSGKDGITIADGSNMIFDHVSVSWGRDETFSINGTVQRIAILHPLLLTSQCLHRRCL